MIEIFKTHRAGVYYFHVKAKNGKIIAQSEGYKRKRDCIKSANLLHELTAIVKDRA